MTYQYLAFVDEAGDDGLNKITPIDDNGASEWFVMSAVVLRREKLAEIKKAITELKSKFGLKESEALHFRKLSYENKLLAANKIAELPLRLFVVISNKRNMRKRRNLRAEKVRARSFFYNWIIRLLLERVTDFCSAKGSGWSGKIRIEFASRGGMDYGHTKDYLTRLRDQEKYRGGPFIKQGKIKWDAIDLSEIKVFRAKQKEGLQASDIVASSFFNALDDKMKHSGTYDFAYALLPRMGRKPDNRTRGRIEDYGLKVMPPPHAINISIEKKRFFTAFGFLIPPTQ